MKRICDIIVVGAGNAALCAAISAKENGANVVVLEKAPRKERGGNTYFTDAALRFPYTKADLKELTDIGHEFVIHPYSKKDFCADFQKVTQNKTDSRLLEILAASATSTIKWMHKWGVSFTLTKKFAVKSGDKFHIKDVSVEAVGEGKGFSYSLFKICRKMKIPILYNAEFTSLIIENGTVAGVNFMLSGRKTRMKSKLVILACGGFESSPTERVKNLGKKWKNINVRGTSHNVGQGIAAALDIGAVKAGQWNRCHAVQCDSNAPAFGDRKLTILLSRRKHHLGIQVNLTGERFLDEGEGFPLLVYAKIGEALLDQPKQIGFQIFDSKIFASLPLEYRTGYYVQANSIENLADKLKIDKKQLQKTVEKYNTAIDSSKPFDQKILDGRSTRRITPPKSNWALTIDTPPYHGYPVSCGITFTFGGIKIDKCARVLNRHNKPIKGLYACGEMAGLFHHNYPGGAGLVAGSVFGKIAGKNAAKRREIQ